MSRVPHTVAFLLLFATVALAGTPGTFRGILYIGRDTEPGWVYIVGHHHTLRLVHIANARILYADELPASERKVPAAKALKSGADVRVTASQDEKGNWRAIEVEIISLSGRKAKAPPLKPFPKDRPAPALSRRAASSS